MNRTSGSIGPNTTSPDNSTLVTVTATVTAQAGVSIGTAVGVGVGASFAVLVIGAMAMGFWHFKQRQPSAHQRIPSQELHPTYWSPKPMGHFELQDSCTELHSAEVSELDARR